MATPQPPLFVHTADEIKAVDRWQGEEITLLNTDGLAIVAVPLLFAEKVNWSTWRLLGEGLDAIISDDTQGGDLLFKDNEGVLLCVDDPIKPGAYTILWNLTSGCPIVPSFSTASTASAQSSDTASQSSFRREVQSRDHACIITGMGSQLQAAHLIPKGDSNGYQTAEHRPVGRYNPKAGVLLWVHFHLVYDAYEGAFLPKFDPDTGKTTFRFLYLVPPVNTAAKQTIADTLLEYHGVQRTWTTPNAPSAALALIHYRRAIGKRLALVKRVMGPPATPPTKRKPTATTPDHDRTPRKIARSSTVE